MDSFTTTNPLSTDGKQHPDHDTDHPPICGEPAVLSLDLVLTALRYADRAEIEPAEIKDVRCTLQAHPSDNHYAFVVDTTDLTSAWTRWPSGGSPEIVLVLPDCSAIDPDRGGACSEYEGHCGGHTWQVDDPWNPVEAAL